MMMTLGAVLAHKAARLVPLPPRGLSEIAQEVLTVWPKPYFGAVPYLEAMLCLDNLYQMFGLDTASDIVLRFLCNAQTFRGPDARRIKAELNTMLKQVKR